MKLTQYLLLSAIYITQAQAYDLPIQPTKSYDCKVCEQLSHETLQDTWPVHNQTLNTKTRNLQTSYSYREKVSSKQLQQGITISTLAPEAIVRITPLQHNTPPHLFIKTPNNQRLNLREASTQFSENDMFGEDRLTIPHQIVMQLKPALGAGQFILKSDDQQNDDMDSYQISVYDKFSTTRVTVETDSLNYRYGDKVNATITLHDDHVEHDIDEVRATVVSPIGQVIPLELKEVAPNQFIASTTLLSELNDQGENWYVAAEVESNMGKTQVRRSGHTAFSYAIPSASLKDLKLVSSNPLTFETTVNVETPSRYALQSVLYAQGKNGNLKPLLTTQKSQWLEKGTQTIQFTFDNSTHFEEDKLFLGYLHLTDYGQLKTVYQFNQPIQLSQLLE